MLIVNNMQVGHRIGDVSKVEKIHARIELPYCDAAKVVSFAVPETAVPALSAGDRLYISSGGTGAYRTVLRVEAIAGGAVMIVLDPRHAQLAAPMPTE
jgi:hypothetical protein